MGLPVLIQCDKHYLVSATFYNNTTPLSPIPEPAIWSCDAGQRICCFGSIQLNITWISNRKVKLRLQTKVDLSSSFMLCDFVALRTYASAHHWPEYELKIGMLNSYVIINKSSL